MTTLIPDKRFDTELHQHDPSAPLPRNNTVGVLDALASTIENLDRQGRTAESVMPAAGTGSPADRDLVAALLGHTLMSDPTAYGVVLTLTAQFPSTAADLLSLLAGHLREYQRSLVWTLAAVAAHMGRDRDGAAAALRAAERDVHRPTRQHRRAVELIVNHEPDELGAAVLDSARKITHALPQAVSDNEDEDD